VSEVEDMTKKKPRSVMRVIVETISDVVDAASVATAVRSIAGAFSL
jgi:hypothetical protein